MIIYILYADDNSVIGVGSSELKVSELLSDIERFAPHIVPKEYHSYVDGHFTEMHKVYKL